MTKHVADDQILASFARKTWELQRRLNEGSLNSDEVSRGLQKLIENEESSSSPPPKLDPKRLDWKFILCDVQNLYIQKLIVSAYFMGADRFYCAAENYAYSFESNSKATLSFPASLMNHLAWLLFLLEGVDGEEEYLIPEICAEKDLSDGRYWLEIIEKFELPIPVLQFEKDGPYPIPQEIQAQLALFPENASKFLNITYKSKTYLLLSVYDEDRIYICPAEHFDFTR